MVSLPPLAIKSQKELIVEGWPFVSVKRRERAGVKRRDGELFFCLPLERKREALGVGFSGNKKRHRKKRFGGGEF